LPKIYFKLLKTPFFNDSKPFRVFSENNQVVFTPFGKLLQDDFGQFQEVKLFVETRGEVGIVLNLFPHFTLSGKFIQSLYES
jgi:hypothetical protein